MPKNPLPAPDERPQPDKFRDLARQIGADEDEKRFEEAVKRVAKAPKPKDEPRDGD